MFHSVLTAALLLVSQTSASPYATCKEVRFSVSGSALNFVASGVVASNPTNLTAVVANASTATTSVSGKQTFAGTFCNPNNQNANSTKLQVFRGSFFTNRESWTALGGTALFNPPLSQYQPYNYSWFDYANQLGYPTLAIDSLGDGASSRPDPILTAQIPYDISLYHNLVQQIRAGTTGQLPKAYSYLIHIGNSLGSQIGNQMAAYYPTDFDLFVLTGFSLDVQTSLPGVSLNLPAPAALVEPLRFPLYPLGYVTSTVEQSLTNSFFGSPSVVDFDPTVADLFFQRRDVVSLGYVLSSYLPGDAPVAANYKGRVLVLTGENDQAFCGLGSSALSPNTQCGPLLAATGALFPAADYNYQSVPKTGHATILHRSSRYVFGVAHSFIAGASYGK